PVAHDDLDIYRVRVLVIRERLDARLDEELPAAQDPRGLREQTRLEQVAGLEQQDVLDDARPRGDVNTVRPALEWLAFLRVVGIEDVLHDDVDAADARAAARKLLEQQLRVVRDAGRRSRRSAGLGRVLGRRGER